ncbi:GNAT family N-acetyltransferase [Streptomyces sp. BI20]|uniref:GNAT family N-acetyltransferase n=1 Tax=Streptomyces sp. BI20 TaxID=3403460 RepID=UPI003C70FE2B
MLIEGVRLREVRPADAAGLADTLSRNRAAMAPVEPLRPDSFYTEAGQAARIEGMLADRAAGRLRPYVLIAGAGTGADTAPGTPIGSINLGNIEYGPLCSGGLGYWIDAAHHGKGLATAAVRALIGVARDDLGLHRLHAGTLLTNHASQRVLTRCGFEEYGLAPRYLHIAGAWRDHRLFQLLLHDDPPPTLV